MSLNIPCISIYQPWAELIVAGIKPIENRTRRSHYTGPLLIHASKKFDTGWPMKLKGKQLDEAKDHLRSVCSQPSRLPRGCIVGAVIQTGCAELGNPVNGWHEKGAYGLLMAGAVKFEQPVPYTGHQGMFKADVQGNISPADAIRILTAIRREGRNG